MNSSVEKVFTEKQNIVLLLSGTKGCRVAGSVVGWQSKKAARLEMAYLLFGGSPAAAVLAGP